MSHDIFDGHIPYVFRKFHRRNCRPAVMLRRRIPPVQPRNVQGTWRCVGDERVRIPGGSVHAHTYIILCECPENGAVCRPAS